MSSPSPRLLRSRGVEYEIETKDHEQSPPRVESNQENVKMGTRPEPGGGSTNGDGEPIFRGDRREMVVVDGKTYVVVDEDAVENTNGNPPERQLDKGETEKVIGKMQDKVKEMSEDKGKVNEELKSAKGQVRRDLKEDQSHLTKMMTDMNKMIKEFRAATGQ